MWDLPPLPVCCVGVNVFLLFKLDTFVFDCHTIVTAARRLDEDFGSNFRIRNVKRTAVCKECGVRWVC